MPNAAEYLYVRTARDGPPSRAASAGPRVAGQLGLAWEIDYFIDYLQGRLLVLSIVFRNNRVGTNWRLEVENSIFNSNLAA